MITVVGYLCSDGEVHMFDAAQRQTPLCGEDTMVIGPSTPATRAMACEGCCIAVLDAVEANEGR